jgi:hypothetical protein
MTITKVSIQESDLAIVVCCGEPQPSDTKVVINDLVVPIQAIYTPDSGFNPQPGDRDQFSIGWSWLGIENWALGDSFSLVNSVETQTVSDYGTGFGSTE